MEANMELLGEIKELLTATNKLLSSRNAAETAEPSRLNRIFEMACKEAELALQEELLKQQNALNLEKEEAVNAEKKLYAEAQSQLEVASAKWRADHDALSAKVSEKDSALDKKQRELEAERAERKKLHDELARTEEQLRATKNQLGVAQEECATAKHQLSETEKAMTANRGELEKKKTELDACNSQLDETRTALVHKQSELAEEQVGRREQEAALARMQNQLDAAQAECTTIKAQLDETEKALAVERNDHEQTKLARDEMQRQLDKKTEDLKQYQQFQLDNEKLVSKFSLMTQDYKDILDCIFACDSMKTYRETNKLDAPDGDAGANPEPFIKFIKLVGAGDSLVLSLYNAALGYRKTLQQTDPNCELPAITREEAALYQTVNRFFRKEYGRGEDSDDIFMLPKGCSFDQTDGLNVPFVPTTMDDLSNPGTNRFKSIRKIFVPYYKTYNGKTGKAKVEAVMS